MTHIITRRVESSKGSLFWEAHTYLQEDLSPRGVIQGLQYRPDGSGTAVTRSEAVFKAISESLERWAFADLIKNSCKDFGFDIDPSTNGMACFPGAFKKQVQRISYLEAVERWALISWWECRLEHAVIQGGDSKAIEIKTPFTSVHVVLAWQKTPYGIAYGFAAAIAVPSALVKAKIELERNIRILKQYSEKPHDQPSERLQTGRILFFSSDQGLQLFEKRLGTTLYSASPDKAPKLVIDSEIMGPWTKYGTVWRCLFDGDYSSAYSGEKEYFFF